MILVVQTVLAHNSPLIWFNFNLLPRVRAEALKWGYWQWMETCSLLITCVNSRVLARPLVEPRSPTMYRTDIYCNCINVSSWIKHNEWMNLFLLSLTTRKVIKWIPVQQRWCRMESSLLSVDWTHSTLAPLHHTRCSQVRQYKMTGGGGEALQIRSVSSLSQHKMGWAGTDNIVIRHQQIPHSVSIICKSPDAER